MSPIQVPLLRIISRQPWAILILQFLSDRVVTWSSILLLFVHTTTLSLINVLTTSYFTSEFIIGSVAGNTSNLRSEDTASRFFSLHIRFVSINPTSYIRLLYISSFPQNVKNNAAFDYLYAQTSRWGWMRETADSHSYNYPHVTYTLTPTPSRPTSTSP